MSQYVLDLGHRPALGRGDFIVAPGNAQAVEWLDRWPHWPGPGLVLAGPPGSGKSHLLAAFAARHHGRLTEAEDLTIASVPEVVEQAPLILVDDVTAAADQAALFHLHNLVVQSGKSMVFAMSKPPIHMGFDLPDWSSRAAALPLAEISEPDDALLGAVMIKQFADRQVTVAPELIAYLLGRMERSFAEAGRIVDVLDRAALERGQAITVPLARKILDGF